MEQHPEMVGREYTISSVWASGSRVPSRRIPRGRTLKDNDMVVVQLVEVEGGLYETERCWGFWSSRFRRVQRLELEAWLAQETDFEEPRRGKVDV